jgi:DnaK suppressor protein
MNTQGYKTKLEEEKKLLESELAPLGHVTPTGEWDAVPPAQSMPEADENDLSDRSEDYEERTATVQALNARLDDINKALTSIEADTFGICESCGKHIEEDRLEANPAAQTCKECMEKVN